MRMDAPKIVIMMLVMRGHINANALKYLWHMVDSLPGGADVAFDVTAVLVEAYL